MKCVICKNGVTVKGKTTVTLNRGESVIVIKDVPARVCGNCGEYYLDDATADKVYHQADEAVKRRAEVEIFRYAVDPRKPSVSQPSMVAEKKPAYGK
jgi:YgiT-type zinc finger domain-containing protein